MENHECLWSVKTGLSFPLISLNCRGIEVGRDLWVRLLQPPVPAGKCFLISRGNLLCFRLCLLPLVLSEQRWKQSASAVLVPLLRYLCTWMRSPPRCASSRLLFCKRRAVKMLGGLEPGWGCSSWRGEGSPSVWEHK